MTKVLVLGVRGMLGSMVAHVLSEDPEIEITGTARRDDPTASGQQLSKRFDVQDQALGPLLDSAEYEWIINAVGVIKPHIDDRDPLSIENAIVVNAAFPYRLAAEAAYRGQRVIQIATDGVFSGANGPYDESARHDALDVYGKTKSLGEVLASSVVQLRCSIFGPERSPPQSLLGRALSTPIGARLSGYTRQRWNGLTTLHFAKICGAVISGAELASPQHLVPADSVSKAELLELALSAYGRHDITVAREPGPAVIDRTLTTCHQDANERLWRAAGYERPPTIADMLRELAAYEPAQLSSAS